MLTVQIHVRAGMSLPWAGVDGTEPLRTRTAADPPLRVQVPDPETLDRLQAVAVTPQGEPLARFAVLDVWREEIRAAVKAAGPVGFYHVTLLADPDVSVIEVPDRTKLRSLQGRTPIAVAMNPTQHALFVARYGAMVSITPLTEVPA